MNAVKAAKDLGIRHNVAFRVLDADTHKVIQTHVGHNSATNGLLTGIGYYLTGQGVLNQGSALLGQFVPKYISLGTMGLINQNETRDGLPAGIGVIDYTKHIYADLSESDKKFLKIVDGNGNYVGVKPSDKISSTHIDVLRYNDYITQCPGYGADGYDINANNNRPYMGLGKRYADRESASTINCELISSSFPRSSISFRDVVPEIEAELPETIDVVFSAMISTGALAQFREPGKDYIYITEAGLWAQKDWSVLNKDNPKESGNYSYTGYNGLLAGYRIAPPDSDNWDMREADNREKLDRQILRVGINQVVQVIWKIQLGSLKQLTGLDKIEENSGKLKWYEFYG